MRRLLLVLATVTVLVLLVDVARPSWTAPVREVAARAAAPVQQLLGSGAEGDRLRAERDELAVRLHRAAAERDELAGVAEARAAGVDAVGRDGEVVTARVVGLPPATSPVGERVLTIDKGTQAGVGPDQTVVTAQGLVGRVLRAYRQTSDVLLLGDPAVVVGVRYGPQQALGVLSAETQPGMPTRQAGELTLTALGETPIEVGDRLSTIGSPGGRPYVADVPVGTVTEVDPDVGQLGRTAVLRPVVDLDSLDHVAVLGGAPG